METITLKSGVQIPQIGLGTFDIAKENINDVISTACHLGYQLLDTATGYQNHLQLASALQSLKTKHPLICTKFNNGDLAKHKTVEKMVDSILQELEIKHIDFLLIHNPKVENFPHVFKELIALKKNNIIRSLGVSNFTIKHLNKLQDMIEHVDINEIELHPLLTQPELIQHCKNVDIKIIAYRPFGYGSREVLENTTLKDIAKKHDKSLPQIILRWLIQHGHVAIPKASSATHLKQNIDIFDFSLSESEMVEINALNKGLRTCTGSWAEFND